MQTSILLFSAAILAQPAETASPSLKTHLEQYFQAVREADRTKSLEALGKSHKADEIAVELPKLELWSKPKGLKDWTFKLPSGRVVRTDVRLPAAYDGSKAVPLVLAYPSAGASVENPLTKILAEPNLQQAWVVMDKPVGGSFYESTPAAADLPALLRELRRRIHVDVDRTYIFGEESGADAAWIAAVMYPHPFAALLAFSGYPRVPYPEQTYPLLLMNLRGTPFLIAWVQNPGAPNPTPVQAVNYAIAQFALKTGLNFQGATLAPDKPGIVAHPARIIAATLAKSRVVPSQVDLWFRYLPQGDAGWLRGTELGGDVWEDEQISIVPAAGADRDAFIADTIREKLFHLVGRIEGQVITVETDRIAAVELRLSPEQVDLAKPVTVIINGRKRFEGPLDTSIKDLLESAYEKWDFQQPVFARKSFTINARP